MEQVQVLRLGKMYFKGEYKSYFGLYEQCVDYCIVFVLFDLYVSEFFVVGKYEYLLL